MHYPTLPQIYTNHRAKVHKKKQFANPLLKVPPASRGNQPPRGSPREAGGTYGGGQLRTLNTRLVLHRLRQHEPRNPLANHFQQRLVRFVERADLRAVHIDLPQNLACVGVANQHHNLRARLQVAGEVVL
jgi:hypothetical protein